MTRLLTIVASILTLPAGVSLAGSVYLLDFELRSLEEPVVHHLERYEGKPVLMMFFEPDCSWCYRQVRTINRLGEDCGEGFTALAVGVNGNRTALQKELRRLRPDFPAYQASPALVQAIGTVDATPLSLLGDANGDFVDWARGYLPTERLREFVQTSGDLHCDRR